MAVTFQVSDNGFLFILEFVETLHFLFLLSELVSHLIQSFVQQFFLLIREETDKVDNEQRAEWKLLLPKPLRYIQPINIASLILEDWLKVHFGAKVDTKCLKEKQLLFPTDSIFMCGCTGAW